MTRILALNDDNHDTTFYFDSDSTGFNIRNLLKFLGRPHTENYCIRYVYLLDISEDDIKAQEAFDVIDCGIRGKVPRHVAFDFLWDVYAKEW